MTKKKVVYKSEFFRIKLSDLQMHMFRKNKKWVELTIINARNLIKKYLRLNIYHTFVARFHINVLRFAK